MIGLLVSVLFFIFFQIIAPPNSNNVLAVRAVLLLLIGLLTSYSIEYFPASVKSKVLNIIGPESGFIWGEEGETYQEREKMRQNLYWGVIIAFIISIGASFVYTWMTNGF